MIELMGGRPIRISFGEVYTAMQQGVVDGAENNVPSWVLTRHIEIAKVFSEDEHASIPDFLVISTKTWNKLTQNSNKSSKQQRRNPKLINKNCGKKLTLTHVLRRKLWGVKL